jgi:hypothetical protein
MIAFDAANIKYVLVFIARYKRYYTWLSVSMSNDLQVMREGSNFCLPDVKDGSAWKVCLEYYIN